MSDFRPLAEVGDTVAIACTPDGRLLAVNDVDGRVWFYAIEDEDEPERLPLELSRAEVGGVLLHPDGTVITYRADDELRVNVLDPRSGALLRSLALGRVERPDDEYDEHDHEYDGEPLSVAEGFHFEVAILERPPVLDWLMPLQIANARRDGAVDWMSELPDELLYADLGPNRFTRMALHPNRRYLAILDRGTWVIDLESGALVSSLGYGVDLGALLEYGEGTHTVGFDERGLLTLASVAISGNPFVQIDRFDVESGALESTTETWRQRWGDPEGSAEFEVHTYDPTTYLPPELIPDEHFKVLFRRRAIELWSRAGLIRGVPIAARTCVIPSFDPASFCVAVRVLLVTRDRVELLDLVTGERVPLRPPIGEPWQTSRLTRIEFDRPGRRVLLWRDQAALLAAPLLTDRWSVCELPEDRRMRDWAFASDRGRAFVIDEAGALWLGDVDPESLPTSYPTVSLPALERELWARPDEIEPFLIYADALNDRGDPRGELIMLHHQGAHAEADALIRRHQFELTGIEHSTDDHDRFDANTYELRWQRGFVRAASFQLAHSGQLDRVLAFLASDSARLLESLELRMGRRGDAEDLAATYAKLDAYLAAARHLPQLRTLSLGQPGEHTLSARLRAALPQLA